MEVKMLQIEEETKMAGSKFWECIPDEKNSQCSVHKFADMIHCEYQNNIIASTGGNLEVPV